ncbi:MAG: hypothetical protein WDA25_09855 [Paracoccaceae bacterium]
MLLRRPDWEKHLCAYLDANAARPFEYGQFDCCLFAAGAVDAMCGTDFRARWAGQYTTAAGALRVMRRAGWDSPGGPFADALGGAIAPLQAMRGDVVSDGENIGLRWGAGALFLTDDGLTEMAAAVIVRGWRVPHG